MSTSQNLYDLLGLLSNASQEDVRRAYFEAARRLHPDVNIEPGATEIFLKVKEAYEVLSDPEKRSTYDASQSNHPEKEPGLPIKYTLQYSRSTLPKLGEPQLIYCLLELIAPPKPETAARPPLNLCLILDRSTSMQGERMDMVKSASIELVRQLNPEDTLSIIVFGDRAEVLLPASRHFIRSDVETRIRLVRTGGGTEILRGLEAGFFEVRRNLSKSRINHIVLLTDGRTYGDERECLVVAEQAAAIGVGITAMGIGTEWNDIFLDNLTTQTGGRSLYISRLEDTHQFFQNLLRGLMRVHAENVTLSLEMGLEVELRYAFRLQPDVTPLPVESPLHLGNVPSASSLLVLLEFLIPPIRAGTQQVNIASGNLSLEIPSESSQFYSQEIRFDRTTGTAFPLDLPPISIFKAMSQITLYRLQEKARQEAEAGNISLASRHLQYLATHLLAQGKRELAQSVLVEAERIHYTKGLSEEGEKQIKYGTRALLLASDTQRKAP
jgi:Ca-activated chloride channel homolog